jgi:hypothetical protein
MFDRSNRSRAAALRSAERRRREDEARRLLDEVPSITSLRIEIVEKTASAASKHVKLIVVQRAPALFVIPCGDASCQDGGHDITSEVMAGLRSRRTEFGGESGCSGMTGSASCSRAIDYHILAAYAKPSA